MAATNAEYQELFSEIADMLELLDQNRFKVRAYRNAARVIGDLTQDLSDMVTSNADLTQIKGIGKDLAEQIQTYHETGTSETYQQLIEQIPDELPELLTLPGLGAKKVRALWQELGITSITELRQAVENQEVQKLAGFGKKTESNILKALDSPLRQEKRFIRPVAQRHIEAITELLEQCEQVKRIEPAGSYRRGKETVGDVDLLVAAAPENAAAIVNAFLCYREIVDTLLTGDTKTSVVLRDGLQVDLRVVPEASFGAALQYFTGSQAHNILIRSHAQKQGLKVNEWGVFRDDQQIAGQREDDVYQALALPIPPPELREDRGELDEVKNPAWPSLIEPADYKGNLHAHSTWSDGKHDIEEIAVAARDRFGYAYWGVTDHSKALTIANGLDEKRLADQIEVVDKLNNKLEGIELLKGVECDILEDGTLDLDDGILKELDFVVVAVHSHFGLERDQQTERILRAMDHPCTSFVAHPSGRLLTRREAYDVDISRLIAHAAERGCYLELNASPWRLDLNDTHCRQAKEAGVKITINSDAHRIRDIENISHGILQARRGWLTPGDVINTADPSQIRELLAKTRLD